MNTRPRPRRSLYDDRFWAHVDECELRLQQCQECHVFRYPPGPVCPECLSEDSTWEPLSGRGRLLSWTRFHRTYFPGMPAPYLVAAIRTDEGPILIGNILEFEPHVLALDMPMRAVLETTSDDDGSWHIWNWAPDSDEPRTQTSPTPPPAEGD